MTFLKRKQNNDLLCHIFTLKVDTCQCVIKECMTSPQNSGLYKCNHCETGSCTSTSVRHLWQLMQFFGVLKTWMSLDAKYGQYGRCSRLPYKWLQHAAICQAECSHCCFLATNLILSKNLLNKQIFTVPKTPPPPSPPHRAHRQLRRKMDVP